MSPYEAPVVKNGGLTAQTIDEKDRATKEAAVREAAAAMREALEPLLEAMQDRGESLELLVGKPGKNGLPGLEGAVPRIERRIEEEAVKREGDRSAQIDMHAEAKAMQEQVLVLLTDHGKRLEKLESNQHRMYRLLGVSIRWFGAAFKPADKDAECLSIPQRLIRWLAGVGVAAGGWSAGAFYRWLHAYLGRGHR